MKEITNFWEVISEYVIEIPIIQRDYAQGRDSTKVNEIRRKIINDMYSALTKDSILEFDFVYGNIEGRDTGEIFVPLDGQQRLTTLYLLHWYLALQAKKFDAITLLKRFSYETRTSSREFCQALVANAIDLPAFIPESKISKALKNEAWFFLSWIKDPTIKAMLQTLDDLHLTFYTHGDLWDKLSAKDNVPIVFRFVKLEDFGLEDDLYIKMNARGKPLTDFENFKAKFEHHLSENFEEELYYFSHKIDGDWTDMFWSPPENAKFDDRYLNFFRVVAINNFALKVDTSSSKLQPQISSILTGIPSILQHIDIAAIRDIKVLDFLPTLKNDDLSFQKISIINLFQDITKSQPTYFQRIMFYSLSRFLTLNGTDDMNALSDWLRIIYNLAKNTEYDEIVEFVRSIKSIDELVSYSNNILLYFSDPQNVVQGFNIAQIEEERIKATLLLKNSDWKGAIISAESHGYFDGQISFILLFTKITNEYISKDIFEWTEQISNEYLSSFLEYFSKARLIFGDNGLKIRNYLWERALLCHGYYWIGKGDRVSLLQNIHRDYSWKRLLRDTENNNQRRGYVKQVLDAVSFEAVEECLQKIIDNHTVTDIRKYFINDPKIIDVCSGRFIQKHNNTYLLLKTSITAGYHKELRSYALYLQLLELYKCSAGNTQYLEQCGINNSKMITKINGHDIQISFESGIFEVVLQGDSMQFDDEKDVIEYLLQKAVLPA